MVRAGITLFAFLALAASASAQDVTVEDSWPIPAAQGDVFGMDVSDDTIWVSYRDPDGPARFDHFDKQGNNLGDGFEIASGSWFPQAIDSYGNGRIYVAHSNYISSFVIDSQAADHNRVLSDYDTADRTDGVLNMEIGITGNGHVAGGSAKKIGFLNFADLSSTHPYYGQSWYGAGITSGFSPNAPWEGCVYIPGGPPAVGTPASCGIQPGVQGPALGQLDSADEIAYSPDGAVLVLEAVADRVLMLASDPEDDQPLNPLTEWGSSGTGNSQLNTAASIVYHPGLGHVLISDPGSYRISEYTTAGAWIRSFGWGALTGNINQFEVCDVDTGGCDSTPANNSNPRSWYTRLEVGTDGKLYALSDISDTMEVISFGDSPDPRTITLAGKPLEVKKGKKTKLTATLGPCADSLEDTALFQMKNGPDWDNLKSKDVNDDCEAKLPVKITKKSKFRAISSDPNSTVLATSLTLTVKVK